MLALGALTLGGLFSYQFGDGVLMGPVGGLVAGSLYSAFGMAAYLVGAGVIGLGVKALLGDEIDLRPGEAIGFIAATVAFCVLLHVTFPEYRVHGFTVGGLTGELLGEISLGLFGMAGTYVVALAVLCSGLIISTPLSLDHLIYGARLLARGAAAAGVYLWTVTTGIVAAIREGRVEEEDEQEVEARTRRRAARNRRRSPGDQLDLGLEDEDAEEASDEVDEEEAEEEEEEEEDAEEEDEDAELAEDEEYEYVYVDEDEAAADEEYEYIFVDEDEEDEAEEDEAEEDEEDEAEEDAEEAPKKRRSRRKKSPVEGESRPRRNRRVKNGDAPSEAKSSKSKSSKAKSSKSKTESKRADELPEIVVPAGPDVVEARPARGRPIVDTGDVEIGDRQDDVRVSEPENGAEPDRPVAEDDDEGDSKLSRAGKKAPPRAHELAARAAKAVAERLSGSSSGGEASDEEDRDRGVKSIPGIVRLTSGEYKLPPSKLFEFADARTTDVDKGFVLEQAERIEHALAQFRIQGKVTRIHPGPVITRYEFKPQPGVKLSKIESLENDMAMALEAIRIRILAPIPGKATVGFEVPNKSRELVYIKEILDGDAFGVGRKAKLPMALGKNITGKPISIDLARAPHLLVAGATGSGKSVGVNSMICSLLFSCSPEDVRMIMIDPKMLELSIYKDIPHLLQPVITDAEQANLAMRWAVDEMERRYAILSAAQVRDIGGFNKKLPRLIHEWEGEKRALEEAAADASADAAAEGEDAMVGGELPGIMVDAAGEMTPVTRADLDSKLGPCPEKMPYIVIVIDEFADLMMVASKEVEASVARIAAKARAAGIHLILATQRPSVDVITGTIKNNFPSRIAFQVTSDIDSRTILDQKGAKQLLGMGDMLYMDRGMQPQRVHGCFVSEDEILEVVGFIKKQARPVYNHQITAKRVELDEDQPERKVDPLYDKAVQIVAESQKVSTSMIQRRLNIGYNRAAKIVEMMEEDGVIGPSRGTTPREVYIGAL